MVSMRGPDGSFFVRFASAMRGTCSMALLLVCLAPLCACGPEATSDAPPPQSPPRPVAAPAPAPLLPGERIPLVMFLGDSLTAGLGLPAEEGFPALVSQLLLAEGKRVRIVNAGVSGDTTAG